MTLPAIRSVSIFLISIDWVWSCIRLFECWRSGCRPSIFPNEESIIRLIRVALFYEHDVWQRQHCYMQVEVFALIDVGQIHARRSISAQAV